MQSVFWERALEMSPWCGTSAESRKSSADWEKVPADTESFPFSSRDIDKVDELMQDIAEQQELADEISTAISKPVGFGEEFDEVWLSVGFCLCQWLMESAGIRGCSLGPSTASPITNPEHHVCLALRSLQELWPLGELSVDICTLCVPGGRAWNLSWNWWWLWPGLYAQNGLIYIWEYLGLDFSLLPLLSHRPHPPRDQVQESHQNQTPHLLTLLWSCSFVLFSLIISSAKSAC